MDHIEYHDQMYIFQLLLPALHLHVGFLIVSESTASTPIDAAIIGVIIFRASRDLNANHSLIASTAVSSHFNRCRRSRYICRPFLSALPRIHESIQIPLVYPSRLLMSLLLPSGGNAHWQVDYTTSREELNLDDPGQMPA